MRGLIALLISFIFIFSWSISMWFILLTPIFIIALTLLIEDN
jgi:hypothetical protein